MKAIPLLVAVLTVALSLAPKEAGAVSRIVHGSACVAHTPMLFPNTLAHNLSGASLYSGVPSTVHGAVVLCPILRNNTTNTNGLTSLRARVYNSTTVPLRCQVTSYSSTGAVLKIVNKSTTTTGWQTIDFGSTMNLSAVNSYYAFSCVLNGPLAGVPAGQHAIGSIRYTEP